MNAKGIDSKAVAPGVHVLQHRAKAERNVGHPH